MTAIGRSYAVTPTTWAEARARAQVPDYVDLLFHAVEGNTDLQTALRNVASDMWIARAASEAHGDPTPKRPSKPWPWGEIIARIGYELVKTVGHAELETMWRVGGVLAIREYAFARFRIMVPAEYEIALVPR